MAFRSVEVGGDFDKQFAEQVPDVLVPLVDRQIDCAEKDLRSFVGRLPVGTTARFLYSQINIADLVAKLRAFNLGESILVHEGNPTAAGRGGSAGGLGGLGGGGLGFVAIVSAPRIYASGAHGEAQIPSLDGSGLF